MEFLLVSKQVSPGAPGGRMLMAALYLPRDAFLFSLDLSSWPWILKSDHALTLTKQSYLCHIFAEWLQVAACLLPVGLCSSCWKAGLLCITCLEVIKVHLEAWGGVPCEELIQSSREGGQNRKCAAGVSRGLFLLKTHPCSTSLHQNCKVSPICIPSLLLSFRSNFMSDCFERKGWSPIYREAMKFLIAFPETSSSWPTAVFVSSLSPPLAGGSCSSTTVSDSSHQGKFRPESMLIGIGGPVPPPTSSLLLIHFLFMLQSHWVPVIGGHQLYWIIHFIEVYKRKYTKRRIYNCMHLDVFGHKQTPVIPPPQSRYQTHPSLQKISCVPYLQLLFLLWIGTFNMRSLLLFSH